ncbi:MAG: hypothetical protein WD775_07565 [Burkholderiales bacterium]
MRLAAALAGLGFAGVALAQAAEQFSFDVSQFEKKPYEFGGYLQASGERQRLDHLSPLLPLQIPGATGEYNDRGSAAAELSGTFRRDALRAQFLAHGEHVNDLRGSSSDAKFYEAYVAWQASPDASWEGGKRTQRWGKGYAWNPVAFLERPKDPEDPELAREGFFALSGSFVRSPGGALQNYSLTPLLVPTRSDLNGDFGAQDHWNPAAKLSLLYLDTDIDFLWLGEGSRSARHGFDFSRNFGTQFELHGEWARVSEPGSTSYLLGLRYLTERETTWIVEVYRNGAGLTEAQFRARPVGRQNPMRDYLYVRASQKEPFDILYFAPSATVIANLDDGSYSLIGELAYTGFKDFELRLRAAANRGDRLTEFGEKPVDARYELRARWYF